MTEQSGRQRVEVLVRFLEVVRRGARALLVTRAVLLWVGLAIAALVVGGLLDYLLRAPMGVRLVGLVLAVGFGVWGFIRFVVPAMVFWPGLAEIALRVESQPVGRGGEMRGYLASAIELEGSTQHSAMGDAMRERVVEEAMERWRGGAAWSVLRPNFAARAAVLAFGIVLSAGAIGVVEPALAKTGVVRLMAPWAGAEWPKRQVAMNAVDVHVQAFDEAIAMRAAVLETNRALGSTPVKVWYRGVVGDDSGAWRSAALTGQRRRDAATGGELYERLIDPADVFASFGPIDDGWIEYRFTTVDDETEVGRVRVVQPPEIKHVRATITPPAYAIAVAERAGLAFGEDIEMGLGDDDRALLSRVLAGSRVSIEIGLSKSVPVPADEGTSWLDDLRDAASDLNVSFLGDRVVLDAVVHQTLRLPVSVVDSFGLTNRDEPVYVLDVLVDDEPEPIVRDPDHDEQLVSTAVLDVRGDGRDDLGLISLSLEQMIAAAPAGSEGQVVGGVEGVGDWETIGHRSFNDEPAGEVASRVDLGALGVRAGEEVWLSVVAIDSYGAAGLGREPVRSAVRRIRVISTSELLDQVQSELSGLRQAAMRLDEQQSELAERLASDDASAALADAQRALTERIAAQATTVERLMDRQARNGLEDEALAGMLADAQAAIREAASASSAAARDIDEAESGEGREREIAEEEAAQEQQRVRDELAGLIDQLDRGEDGWVARRSVEQVLEEQRELFEQTQAAGERMLGRDGSSLTPEEQTELDRIAERQREVARRAADAIDGLGERGRQLSEADPAQAAAMAEAERQGREQEVAESLEQAADDVGANRTSSAQAGQQQAMDALEQMLDELDNAERQRNAALLRQLASLIQSIQGLIGAQEDALARLIAHQDGREVSGLDDEMIRLRGNTLAVSADATGPDLMRIRGLIDRAAEAQEHAIAALRAEPMDGEEAERREQTSLLRLREALTEAERQEAETEAAEQEQQRRELRQAYREQLEQQVVLRDESAQLSGEQLTRRERATARGIGQRQSSIRDAMADLLKSTEGLDEATVFVFAHRRLDQLMARSAERLGRGEVDSLTLRDQDGAVNILRSLVEVLGNDSGPQNEFDQGADGQSQGQSGGGEAGGGEPEPLLPPIKELMLLRAMQAEVAVWTRLLDESGQATREDIAELGALQREIADEARSLIERMEQQNNGGGQSPDVLPEPGTGFGAEVTP